MYIYSACTAHRCIWQVVRAGIVQSEVDQKFLCSECFHLYRNCTSFCQAIGLGYYLWFQSRREGSRSWIHFLFQRSSTRTFPQDCKYSKLSNLCQKLCCSSRSDLPYTCHILLLWSQVCYSSRSDMLHQSIALSIVIHKHQCNWSLQYRWWNFELPNLIEKV